MVRRDRRPARSPPSARRSPGQLGLDHQTVAVLHQHVAHEAESRLLAAALANSRASGSVVEPWFSLVRRSPWKSRLVLRPPAGGSSSSSFGRKLLSDAQASTSLPSTVKCPRLNKFLTWR